MSPSPRTTRRRGFTLMEMMLAIVLGSIIVFSATSIFALIDKANKLQEARLARTQEFVVTHRTIANALRSLDMSSDTRPREDELKTKIEDYVSKNLDPESAGIPDEDTNNARFLLQPNPALRDASGRAMQTLEITVRMPPILGDSLDPAKGTEEQMLAQQELARMLGESVRGSKAGSSSARKPSARLATALRKDGASGPLSDSLISPNGQTDANLATDPDAPRAEGLRGVFELRPDSPQSLRGSLAMSDIPPSGIWSLWWREIPADVQAATADNNKSQAAGATAKGQQDADAIALARQTRTDGWQIKLLSGLTEASWQVYQKKEMLRKANAKFDVELPAYVILDFKTIDNREEHWLFEVAWTTGAEPGTVVANANDPLGPGGLNIAAIVQDTINRKNGGAGGGGTGGGTQTALNGQGGNTTGTGTTGGLSGSGTQVAGNNGSGSSSNPSGNNGSGGSGTTTTNLQLVNPGLPDDVWQRIIEENNRRTGGRR